MSESICRFIPVKNENSALKTVRFVYETEHSTLKQPLFYPLYFLAAVTRGDATLSLAEEKYALSRGDLLLIPPAVAFTLAGTEDFAYVYITFMGTDVPPLLFRMGISIDKIHYPAHPELLPTFENAIRRLTPSNANTLTESVLFYTLSFLSEKTESEDELPATAFDRILGYVDRHFSEHTLSLARLAQHFSYTEKYLSALFKRRMQIGFNEYLNRLRIQNAQVLIEAGHGSIAEIAYTCGYSDPSYFSRIYKEKTGISPSRMLSILSLDRKQERGKKKDVEKETHR